jgi:hypothetical protein
MIRVNVLELRLAGHTEFVERPVFPSTRMRTERNYNIHINVKYPQGNAFLFYWDYSCSSI